MSLGPEGQIQAGTQGRNGANEEIMLDAITPASCPTSMPLLLLRRDASLRLFAEKLVAQ